MRPVDRRLALAGCAAIAVTYGFARYGYGLLVPIFRDEFGLSVRAVGLVASASYVAYMAAMISTGWLTERRGPRLPVLCGLGCATVGLALMAAAGTAAVLVTGAVVAAASPGFCWAPFSEAARDIDPPRARERVLSIISTGTSLGLVVAGAAVAAARSDGWRAAVALFAIAAAASGLLNAHHVPARPSDRSSANRSTALRDLVDRTTAPLFGQAFSYGALAGFYFTYAVSLVSDVGSSLVLGAMFWAAIGIAGMTGVLAGDAAAHHGLRRSLTACLLVLALSIGGLSAVSSPAALLVCGLVFGASYMPIAAILQLWSARVFDRRPAAGFTAVLVALGIGSVVGPAVLGTLAEAWGLPTAFGVAAVLTAVSALLRPSVTSDW